MEGYKDYYKDFSHLIAQVRHFSEDDKIHSSVVSNIFPAQRDSLPVRIVRTVYTSNVRRIW